jgi:hypothetical protein
VAAGTVTTATIPFREVTPNRSPRLSFRTDLLHVYYAAMKVISAFARAALIGALGVWALVLIQRGLGWTPMSSDPSSVSSYLSALAQFAAIPVTLALGILVLVIQLQAGALTSRAGALAVTSPEFLFTVAFLLEAPAYCILLLGILDLGQGQVSVFARELAFGAVVPVLFTLRALFRFTDMWFRLVSPAAFTGLIFQRAVQGLQEKNRDAAVLAVRGLGESVTSLVTSNDYAGVRLCANQIGMLLEGYVEVFKPNMPEGFFYYDWPQRRYDREWLEREACDSMRDAADTLMLRGGPEGTIIYLAERLTPFGQKAIDVGDTRALEVLAETFAGMGTTEKTFMVAANFNPGPLYECANLVLTNTGREGKANAVNVLAAAFFLIFTYIHHYTERRAFTSSEHETFARRLKAKGINFPEVAKLSREKFGVWNVRFADPDREAQKALRKIKSL